MKKRHTQSVLMCLATALTLTACSNPFGASTQQSQNGRSGASSAGSPAAQGAAANSSASASAAPATTSAFPSPSPSVVTVTAQPAPSTVTVTATPDKDSQHPASSGRQALEENTAKLRGNHDWDVSDADTSTYNPDAELSWIVVGASDSDSYHIMLFHYGDYLGTGTVAPMQYEPEVHRTAANQVRTIQEAEYNTERTVFTWDRAQHKIVLTGDTPSMEES